MVSKPLLWPFLSSLVFISVTSFSTLLPPSQQSPLQTLLRLRFWRYHRDRLALIYKIMKASTLSETACTPMRRSKFLYGWSRAPCASTHRLFRSRIIARPHALSRACWRHPCQLLPASLLTSPACVSRWRHPLTLGIWPLTSRLTVDFSLGLTFSIQILFTQFFA